MTKPSRRTVLLLLGRYSHQFHLGVSRYAGQAGWHLCADMASTGVIPDGWQGDGIVTSLNDDNKLVRFIRRTGVPVVDLILQRPDIDVPRVTGDNEAIGRVAADHFIERGFRHFAWYSDYDTNVERCRLKGFGDRLATRDFSCQALVWRRQTRAGHPGTWHEQRAWIVRHVRRMPKPLAVLAFSDYDAATFMDACLQGGFHVPDEVAVLGINNSELICDCLAVPLSSVNHDMERVGYEGAALLDRLMDGGRAPAAPVLIPPRGITLRQSTDILAVNQPQIRAALTYLRDHLGRSIGTADAAAAAGVPKRVLERLFRKHLNCTVHEELIRLRIQQARELLLYSKRSAGDIAKATGFCHPQHFNNAFRRSEGVTPKRFRSTHAGRTTPGKPAPLASTMVSRP